MKPLRNVNLVLSNKIAVFSSKVMRHVLCYRTVWDPPRRSLRFLSEVLSCYHQIDEWARDGAILSEATVANWMLQAAKYLRLVWNQIHVHLLQMHFLQGDETPYQVIREPRRKAAQKSYIWVMRSTHQWREPAVYYHYAPTSLGEVAKEIYAGFDGIAQIGGYNKLVSDIT